MLAALAAVGVIIFPGLSSATPTDKPTVTTGAATSVANVSATLNGTVNPNDPDTSATYDYTFSLGTDSNNLSNAGGGSIPGDTNDDPVSLPVSGLSPNTTYYFQLCAVNDADVTDSGCGATQSFQTPDQPAVTLGSASAVTSTSATLNGSVDPNGDSTSYLFYYGTSSHPDCNFYSDSVGGSAGNGTSSTPESKSISGLSPNTKYYFRLAASNNYGTVCSSTEGSFTTSDKPVVTLGSASAVTNTTATLNGSVNPNGDATTYVFVYGTSSSADCTHYSSSSAGGSAGSGTSSTPESNSISGLSPKTKYFFRLSATNGNGTTCSSTEGSFTTQDKPTVTLGSASSVTNTSATLSGSVNPNGAATTYVFHYGTSSSATCSGYSGTSTGGSAGSGTSSTPESDSISGLSPNTKYYFRLAATNTYGTTCSGTEGSFTTADAPTEVTGDATSIGTNSATLAGTVNPNGANVTSAVFNYCTGCANASGGVSVAASPSPGSGTSPVSVSASLGGLQSGALFHYMLCATNVYGTTCGADKTFKTNVPPTAALTADKTGGPTPLVVTFNGAGSSDSDGSIASWSLTFGDGSSTSGSGSVPSSIPHTYSSACSCTASLTVTDNQGAQSAAATFGVHVTTNQPPVSNLSGTPLSGTVPLDVSFDGSASNDPDGIPLKSWSLAFGDGNSTGGNGAVPNAIAHTYAAAGTYQAVLTVTDSSNASTNSTPVTVTVNPQPSISIGDVSKNEGNSGTTNFVFPLTLSAKSTHDVTVAYATANGTAAAGSDYTAKSGTLTIPAGTDCTTNPAGNPPCTITVAVTGDTSYEANETFTLTLSNPTGATLTRAVATGTIVNDDQQPGVMIERGATLEGNAGSLVDSTGGQSWSDGGNLKLADAKGFPSSFAQHTFYISTPGSQGESGPFTYTGVSGNTLTGVSPAGSVTVGQWAFQPRFVSIPVVLCDVQQTQANGGVCVPTTSGFDTTVKFKTSDGHSLTTSIPVVMGQDYVYSSGTLTIPAGQSSGSLDFQTIPNTTPENPTIPGDDLTRWFNVLISAPTNATIVPGGSLGSGTIIDDDAPNPPKATTGSASAIGTNHVTLSATVNPNGPATNAYIEYGPTAAYGTQTAKQSLPAGSTDQTLSFSLTGLSPGTTYHYEVVATHADGGTGYGGDATFKTDVPPTAVLTADKTTADSPPLMVKFDGSGSADSDGSIAAWTLDFGDGTSKSGTGPVPSSILHTYASSCTCAATLTLTDNQGGRSAPATVLIKVKQLPKGPDPQILSYDDTVRPTSAQITLTVDPKGAETKVWVEYGTDSSYGRMSEVKTIEPGPAQTLTVPLPGLFPRTAYHYRLFASHTTDTGAVRSQDLLLQTPPLKSSTPTLKSRKVTVGASGTVPLPLSCGGNDGAPCKGRASLRLGKTAAGSKSFSIVQGHQKRVMLKLKPAILRRLKASGGLWFNLALTTQTTTGKTSTKHTTVFVHLSRK